MTVRDWPSLIGGTAVLFLFGLLCTLFPMKVMWIGLNSPKWSVLGLLGDDAYPPYARTAKLLFDNDRKKFQEEYAGWLWAVRLLGLLPLFMSFMFFFLIILPALPQ